MSDEEENQHPAADKLMAIWLVPTPDHVRCNDIPVRLWVGRTEDGQAVVAAVVGISCVEANITEPEALAEWKRKCRESGLGGEPHEPVKIQWSKSRESQVEPSGVK